MISTSEEFVRVFKYQALGNSYIILDPRYKPPASLLRISSCGTLRPLSGFVKLLCDVAKGIGSNGILFGPLPSSIRNRYQMLIINSDGTSAGFSGNGTRIFAKYLMDEKIAPCGQTIEFEIPEENSGQCATWNVARIQLPLRPDGLISVTAPHMPRFGIEAVGAISDLCSQFASLSNRMIPRYNFAALSAIGSRVYGSSEAWSNSVVLEIGNPHCVTFVKQLDYMPSLEILRANDASLKKIAFRGQVSAPVFPNGVNLQWVWPESRKRLQLVIYERGEGPTPASGSSACAAACAAFSLGLIEDEVEVAMPGGSLAIRLEGRPAEIDAVTLIGSATRIFDGTVSVSREFAEIGPDVT